VREAESPDAPGASRRGETQPQADGANQQRDHHPKAIGQAAHQHAPDGNDIHAAGADGHERQRDDQARGSVGRVRQGIRLRTCKRRLGSAFKSDDLESSRFIDAKRVDFISPGSRIVSRN